MFALLVCALALHQVQAACVLVSRNICPENTAVQAEITDVHNALRRAVQPSASDMLKMNYSEEIAVSVQAWLDKCILGHGPPSTRMLHGYGLGENLFYSNSPESWTDIINAWNSERAHFIYPNVSSNGEAIGHYTQLVWNSSYRVGCGVALCPNNLYYYGCRYYRAGNFRGWIPYKVGPPCASCPNACEDKLCTNPCSYINRFLNCPSLVKAYGCDNHLVSGWCPASCRCPDEIIPISKR
ncbi:Cysteine-rich venom protein DIS2 [Collichthys lucidus]|uniref:Cysteine-rich venom protein DIS2 n=1 Tax=Collichthys lucidus TaxID=240159 RepID=A0A4U5V434_COLLU|nr:Cysteine-rich venom protein DIS2 [Collichthys lucidus]